MKEQVLTYSIFRRQTATSAATTGYRSSEWATSWTTHGSNPRRRKKFFSSLKCQSQLCCPPSFLFSGHWWLFPQWQSWLLAFI